MAIHADIIANLERRSVDKAAAELERRFSSVNANLSVEVKQAELAAAAAKIKAEIGSLRAEVKVDVDRTAFSRMQQLGGVLDSVGHSLLRLTDGAGDAHKSLMTLGTTAIRTARGIGAIGIVPASIALLDFAKVAVTASQSIALLPAVASAAGAGIGTLAIATSGFSDAIGDMRDPKKFAADLQLLGPGAQQAALSIQALLPELDKLRDATQNAFFADFGGRGGIIEQLASAYLPQVQEMTTGIAGAFNTMMKNISAELMTPETQGQIQNIMANITEGFQNAAPAAQSLLQVFVDLTDVGSEFLPGFGSSIAELAAQFADFIRNAKESGKLKEWMQEGIDAVKSLAEGAWELVAAGKELYDFFTAGSGIDDFKDDMQGLRQIIALLTGDFSFVINDMKSEFEQLTNGPARDFVNFWLDIPEAIAKAANAVKHVIDGMMTNLVTDLNHMADILPDSVNKTLFGTEHPKPFSFTPSADFPAGGDWGQLGYPDQNPQHQPNRTSRPDRPGPPGLPGPTGGRPVPAAPGPPGANQSDADRRAAIAAGLDPNSYRVDPYAQVPGLPPGTASLPKGAQGPMGMATGTPYGGTYQQDPQKILEAQHAVELAGHDLEEARKDRLVLEKDNQANSQEISDAKWKETEAGWKLQKEQANLADAIQGTYNKTTDASNSLASAMGELGAGLDKDLGISKGLPGIADNLVRFLGNLALAPMMGQLAATKAASPSQGGYGLMGILGAQGAFGPRFTGLGDPNQQSTTGGPTGTNPYSGGIGGVAQYAGDAALLSNVPRGVGKYDSVTKDLSQGLVDCASGVEDLVNIMDGKSTVGGSLWTGNAASVLPQMGFLPGMGGPGDFRIGYNSQHMQATLPGGTNVNYGSTPAIQSGGIAPNEGAYDPAFTSHYYRPAGANAGSGGYQQVGSTPYGSIPIPLPVTIVGGGAGGGGAVPVTLPGMPGGAGGGGRSLWDAVAQAESSGNWQSNTGNNHYGGLQFSPSTWKAFGGVGMPQDASREQQIAIANRTAFTGYNGTPPQGLGAWEAITKGMVPGVTTATPASSFGSAGGPPPAPGRPGYTPGVGYVDSQGNPTGYNPGGAGPLPNLPAGFGGTGAPLGIGSPDPMAGSAAGLGLNPQPGIGSAATYGGLAPIAPNPGGGGFGITPGGTIDTAANLAAMAFPGVGQAAATGMKLANRAIEYAGQVAGIGASGLLETFLPSGGSELANNSWLTRITGAIAGAAPALPNIAGGVAAQGKGQPPVNPADVASGQGAGPPPGPTQITVNNNRATEDGTGRDIAAAQQAQYTPPGVR